MLRDKRTRTIIGTVEKLGVEVVLANSLQSKGRLERPFGTALEALFAETTLGPWPHDFTVRFKPLLAAHGPRRRGDRHRAQLPGSSSNGASSRELRFRHRDRYLTPEACRLPS